MRLLTLAGVALIAAATLAGARLGRSGRLPARWMVASAGVLLAVLAADAVPEVRHDLLHAGLPWWAGPAATATGVAVADALVRRGCACHRRVARGAAGAAAIGAHRALEGSTLAAISSTSALAAFAPHAAVEGLALGSLLRGEPRRTVVTWIVVACASPVVGATVLEWAPLPDRFSAVVAAAAVGALVRAALSAFQAAHGRGRSVPQPPESSISAPAGTAQSSRLASQPSGR